MIFSDGGITADYLEEMPLGQISSWVEAMNRVHKEQQSERS